MSVCEWCVYLGGWSSSVCARRKGREVCVRVGERGWVYLGGWSSIES